MQRVLIVDSQTASARLLSDTLRATGPMDVVIAADVQRALAATRTMEPQVIFVEHPSTGVDGYAFTRQLRRSDSDARKAPVIMITAEATAAAILSARDAGLHEFLRKPFTIKDVERRIEAVILRPRDWIEGVNYVGPDRRRFNSADYGGPRKRRGDARQNDAQNQLQQALQIVRAAAVGYEGDPKQARRAIDAQLLALKPLVGIYPAMAAPLVSLECWDLEFPDDNDLARDELKRRADAMMPFMPPEQVRAA
ncbi:MAG: response regulator [Caulobacterales bacterium]|nr:response regulator [Caulobacterales bacterium]